MGTVNGIGSVFSVFSPPPQSRILPWWPIFAVQPTYLWEDIPDSHCLPKPFSTLRLLSCSQFSECNFWEVVRIRLSLCVSHGSLDFSSFIWLSCVRWGLFVFFFCFCLLQVEFFLWRFVGFPPKLYNPAVALNLLGKQIYWVASPLIGEAGKVEEEKPTSVLQQETLCVSASLSLKKRLS